MKIIEDLSQLKKFHEECEQKYGAHAVEKIMDACHALQFYAVDRHPKPEPLTAKEKEERRLRFETAKDKDFNLLMHRAKNLDPRSAFNEANDNKPEREENILRYIAENAPHLENWKRELMVRYCTKAQYFMPVIQTKLMNEGWATYWHNEILRTMNRMKLIDDGSMLELIHSNSGVIAQPTYDSPYYQGFNPYKLGVEIFKDIRRICENPTDEDRQWFPQLAGKPAKPALFFAMKSFRDETFVAQYLSPKVIRDFRLFEYTDDPKEKDIVVSAIHDERGYQTIRNDLAAQYSLSSMFPTIEIEGFDKRGDRTLTIHHLSYNDKPLHAGDTQEVLKHIHFLWQHPVHLKTINPEGKETAEFSCQPK